MSSFIVRTHNGIEIPQREDGYISLTKMAKATDKKVSHYTCLQSTQEFLEALSSDAGIPASELLQEFRGFNIEQGTYAHPDVAIHFAQWANPAFAVQVSKWMRELMNKGSVSIKPALSKEEQLEQARNLLILNNIERVEKVESRLDVAEEVQQETITKVVGLEQKVDKLLIRTAVKKRLAGDKRTFRKIIAEEVSNFADYYKLEPKIVWNGVYVEFFDHNYILYRQYQNDAAALDMKLIEFIEYKKQITKLRQACNKYIKDYKPE